MTTLADKVAFLSRQGSYPHPVSGLEVCETHMSWVFLAGDRVYKMKKPVRRPHVDYTTLPRRRHGCEEEVRLNRRLAPNVYLGVVPLRAAHGRLAIGGTGEVVEWLVEMVRLPAVDMLDVRIVAGNLPQVAIERVGDRLAAFYSELPGEQDVGAYLARMEETLRLDGEVLCRPEFGLSASVPSLLSAAEAALAQAAPEIRNRAAQGWLVEGHGDLRPEHVCLTEPPQIFDCLEFDRAYRVLDPYDEIAYLGLECAVLGADWIGPALIDRLSKRLGGRPPADLIRCYGALSGLTRARLCLAHLLEVPARLPEKWGPLARRYLAAAEVLLQRPRLG